jgi:virulence-associated protein VagC
VEGALRGIPRRVRIVDEGDRLVVEPLEKRGVKSGG